MPLYVGESGTPRAPTVLFLHGIGTSGWMWWRQTAALDDFHSLTVDLPGHGQSNTLPWVSLADTAQQVAAVIAARATNGQAHVVGLSLGAYVALVLLEQATARVQRAVLSGVTAAPMPNRFLLKPQMALMSLMNRRTFAERQARALNLPPDAQAAFIENWLAMSMQTYRNIWEEVAEFEAPAALHLIDVPTLVTAGGTESRIIQEAVAAIPQMMPRAEGRIAPGRGHGWNVEAPDLFNAMVRAWITGTPLPSRLQGVRAGHSLRR